MGFNVPMHQHIFGLGNFGDESFSQSLVLVLTTYQEQPKGQNAKK